MKKICLLIKTTNWKKNLKTSHIFYISLFVSFKVSFKLKYIFRGNKYVFTYFFFLLQKESTSHFFSLNMLLRKGNINLTSCITWLTVRSVCIFWLRYQLINIYGIWYKRYAIEGQRNLEILKFLRTTITKWCTHELVS
jgi:hypothetical protein